MMIIAVLTGCDMEQLCYEVLCDHEYHKELYIITGMCWKK